jgi:predicted nucleic acid-binding protein
MISGVDTTFMVQAEVREHPEHEAARKLLTRTVAERHTLAVAPQVLLEFVHVVSDKRRFERPLSVGEATLRALLWWESKETRQIFPNAESMRLFSNWMTTIPLGRKRILDTMLAATFHANDIRSVITSNVRDFTVFGVFDIIRPVE